MPEKDATEKTLEAFNDVFSDIINVLVFKGKRVVKPEDLQDATPYSMYKADGKAHGQSRDVAKYWVSSAFRISSFGLENQTAYNADEPLVVIGYDGGSYKDQVDTDDKKGPRHRYPVVTLVLYFGSTHWNANKTLKKALDFPDWSMFPDGSEADFMEVFKDYGTNIYEIAFLSEAQIDMFRSDFRVVADLMVHRRINPDYRPEPWVLKHAEATLMLLSTMTGDRRYEQVLNEEWEGGRPNTMDPYLDRIEAKGEEKGIVKGRVEGENLLASLMQKLFALKRLDDAEKAASDEKYRKKLYEEFNLA